MKAEWGGPATNIADTVIVDADLRLRSTGVRRRGALSDIPVTGQILGHYDGKTETVNLPRVTLNTPQSTLAASGVLGVSTGDRFTKLNVDLSLRNLGELRPAAADVGSDGQRKEGCGRRFRLRCMARRSFHGTASGEIAKLDVKGTSRGDEPGGAAGADFAAGSGARLHLRQTWSARRWSSPAPAIRSSCVHGRRTCTSTHWWRTRSTRRRAWRWGARRLRKALPCCILSGAVKPRLVYVHRKPTYVWESGHGRETPRCSWQMRRCRIFWRSRASRRAFQ